MSTNDHRQHGVKGVYYAGDWLDIEDCAGLFTDPPNCSNTCHTPCPRSRSRNTNNKNNNIHDVVIIGAGCVGASIARELSKYQLTVLLLEAADDVSQGATKGNSGIVHAGYDDTPGTNRAKYCWTGNQMFGQLDKELRFGYQKNGSLVVAFNQKEKQHLYELKQRGETNGVQRLRVIEQEELRTIEPAIHPDAIAALHSPDAGNVIPYEFTIALAENAVDNGVELRIRRQVTAIQYQDNGHFVIEANYWEPKEYIDACRTSTSVLIILLQALAVVIFGHYVVGKVGNRTLPWQGQAHVALLALLWLVSRYQSKLLNNNRSKSITQLVKEAGEPKGSAGTSVKVEDMLIGGSGAATTQQGQVVAKETFNCKYVVNCAGGASDQIARLIGDDSFAIKPRLGDYLLLNRNQGHLASHTIFPCPDPVLGKGVLVQTTLWGNLILGPTARDVYKAEARDMEPAAIQEYILSKCKQLVPSFDPQETIHAFCGARAKSTAGDWIIRPSAKNGSLIHVAGIDSPGLAGSPAIAVEVVRLLSAAGLELEKNPHFNPNRAPIISPKDGMKGLKMGPVGKFDGRGENEEKMAQNVICKCEKVTELEVVRAMRRSLPIDSSQGIRKRTRAGMGHCQGDPDNYNCEARVRAIIARENGVPISQVGHRPWPATSTLSQRWIDYKEKQALENRKNKA